MGKIINFWPKVWKKFPKIVINKDTSHLPQGTKQNRRWQRRWQGERWPGAGCWHTRDTSPPTLNNARPDPGPGHGPSKMHPNKGDLINLRSVQFIASIRGKSLQNFSVTLTLSSTFTSEYGLNEGEEKVSGNVHLWGEEKLTRFVLKAN